VFRIIHSIASAVLAVCFVLGGRASANDHVMDLSIDAIVRGDNARFGFKEGDPAAFTVRLDFGATTPIHPNPVSSLYGGVPGSAASLVVDDPSLFQYTGDSPTADVLIDGGFHVVELHIQDFNSTVLVGGTVIDAVDLQLDVMLRDTTGDALFPTGDLSDLSGLGDQLDAFEVQQFRVVIGTELGNETLYLDMVGLDITEIAPPDEPYFRKFLIGGPDRNNDGEIDLIIEANAREPSTYTFRIEVNQPDLPPMLVIDHVISDWTIVSCLPDNPADLVFVFPAGSARDPSHILLREVFLKEKASVIQWFPAGNVGGLTCTITTSRRGRSDRFAPGKCRALPVNLGAVALNAALDDEIGNALLTNKLFVGAMKDKSHDGVIDWSGNGDEDGDGLTDGEEIFELGTDPCKRNKPDDSGGDDPTPPMSEDPSDFDGDGVPDEEDACPESDPSPIVYVGYVRTGLQNRLLEPIDGCTLADVVQRIFNGASHGTNRRQFMGVFNVSVTNLEFEKRITPHEAGALRRAAAHYQLP